MIRNLPNFLTASRILFAFAYLGLAWAQDWKPAFWVFIVAALTDMVDGTIARLMRQKTELGAFLDPVADKFLMFIGFVSLTAADFIPLGLTLLVFARDLMISVGVFYFKLRKFSMTYQPIFISKVTTLLQFTTLLAALWVATGKVSPFRGVDLWATGFFTLLSGILYGRMGWRLLGRGT